MTEETENSSLPLLLTITGAVVLVAVGGWFFLEADPVERQAAPMPLAAPAGSTEAAPAPENLSMPDTDAPLSLEEEAAVVAAESDEATAGEAPESEAGPSSLAAEVDAELRKARLAAEADILIFPEDQSAIRYYGNALQLDPANPVATAELDVVLGKVLQAVNAHLNAQQWNEAYRISTIVARYRPGHELVTRTQETLDGMTEALVNQVVELAQAGDGEQAALLLAQAEALPGRNPQYFAAIRESIAEIESVLLAAEQDRAERAALAEEAAKAAWVDRISSAIANGNLISPAGASARDLLRESNAWVDERQTLQSELLSALVARTEQYVADDQLDAAENYLNAAVELSGTPDGFDELRTTIEERFVEKESTRIAQMTELVRLKTVPARYPRRAEERGISGWVDVLFTISPSGETTDVVVHGAEPENVFERAAVEAVEQWEFQPVEYRGRVISQRAGAKLVFRLAD